MMLGGYVSRFLIFVLFLSNASAQVADWLCRFQNTTCGTLFEHGQWDLVQEEGQINVYLEANFTSHFSQEGDTATFVIEHEFNSYAGELQFFFFSTTESSPNITETSPNITDRKPGSFSITTCKNDNRPLFYIEHYKWEWVFIERLPYSCDNKDDVEIKFTAINGGSRTIIRVDAILIFEMPSLPETVTEDSLPRSPDAVTAESPDYLGRESHEKQDPAQITMILSIALAVTATLFLCTLIIIAILLCDHDKLIRPDASIKLDAHSEFKSSGHEHDESLVKGICTIQTSSRDVQDGASTDTSEVIWNMIQMESAEEEFKELKDAFPPMQGRGFVDAEKTVVKTQLKDPKLYLESKATPKMTHQSGGYPRIDQRPSKNSTGKVIARPEEAFEDDVNSFEGKVDFVSNPVNDRIPNGHTQTGDGHGSPVPNGKTNSRKDDVWFGLGITFYRNQDTDDTGLTRNPLGHHLDYITEDRDYAAHTIINHGNSGKGGSVPVGMARSRATALARHTIDGVDALESNC